MKKFISTLITVATLFATAAVMPITASAVDTFGSADALEILRYVAGATTLTAEQLARYDLTGDGAVTSADALAVLRIVAGSGTTTPPPVTTPAPAGEKITVDITRYRTPDDIPNSDAMTAIRILFKAFGYDVTNADILSVVEWSNDFYTEDGRNIGPHMDYVFVGNPYSSNSNDRVGAGMSIRLAIETIRLTIINQGIERVELRVGYANVSAEDMIDYIDNYIRTIKTPMIAIVTTGSEINLKEWWAYNGFIFNGVKSVDQQITNTNGRYVVIYGVDDNNFYIYDPATGKDEIYKKDNPISVPVYLRPEGYSDDWWWDFLREKYPETEFGDGYTRWR